MDDELVLADQQARTDALDVTRSFLVQAPAGSGKTELLIQRYLRLLAVVAEPEEVVAITFTRKAAQEMRQRVINALHRARDGVPAAEAHEIVTQTAARAVLERDAEFGWALLLSPGRMRIQTLDSFNAGITRSLPVSSGLGGISRTAADAEMQAIYKEAATATIDWLGTGEAMDAVVARVLSHLDNNTDVYVTHLSRMLQSRDQWLAMLGSGLGDDNNFVATRAKLEQGIARVISAELRRASELIPSDVWSELPDLANFAAGNLINDQKADEPIAHLHGMSGEPACDVRNVQSWISIADLLLTRQGGFRKSLNKNIGFPPSGKEQKDRFKLILEQLAQVDGLGACLQRVKNLPPARYSDEQWLVLTALFRLLPQAVGELRLLFGQRSVCDHIEIAMAASEALGFFDAPGDIALALDYRIQHLLVDEMQDTSLRQYQLLETLTESWTPGDGKTLFCVGDPMQSIYRFRDAEVGQFVIARDQGIGVVRPDFLLLRRNFRSGEHLVHWFNTVFSRIMPVQDNVAAGSIAYAASVPVEMHAGSGNVNLHPLIDFDASAEAQFAADLIHQCQIDNAEDTIAVLVRSRTQLVELLIKLREQDIAFEAVEIDRLTDLPEIIDLLAITRALCHEGDRTAWLALLHGPLVGLGWRDILSLVVNDSHRTVFELMSDPDRVSVLSPGGQKRLSAFTVSINAVQKHTAIDSLRERVERYWFQLGGPALLETDDQLTNVYQYLDVLEKIESAGTLTDISELSGLLDQERVTSSTDACCSLQIMTMHKAKGLQFDHVFVYGLGRATRATQKSVLSWLSMPGRGEADMILSPIGPRAVIEHDRLHQYIEATEKGKQRHELDRLLYVACTRARKQLHLIGSAKTSADGENLRGPTAGSLLDRMWPAVETVYASAFDEHIATANQSQNTGEVQFRNPLSRQFSSPWYPADVPTIPLKTPDTKAEDAEQQVQFYWVGALARHAGTIVHRWLRHMTASRDIHDRIDVDKLKATSIRWARQLGVADGDLEAVSERVAQAIDGTMNDDKGRWILGGDGFSELPLTGLWKGRLSSIVIDRVRIDDDNVHWIVDYKTSTHEGGDLATFLQHESVRYRDQLNKYAEIYSAVSGATVRTALYFPMLQEFCEV